MKNFATKLAAIAATTVISLTGMAFADAQGFQVGVGYRQDSLKWDLRDSGRVNPHSKSQQHFKDLEIVLLGAKYKGLLGCCVYARVNYDYGWVVDGRLREKITFKDFSEAEHFDHNGVVTHGDYAVISSSHRRKNNSYVWDLNLGFGMPWGCWCDIKFAPMIGFSYDRYHLKFSGNRGVFVHDSSSESLSVIVDSSSSSSSSSCSNSSSSSSCHHRKHGNSHETSFWGPWIGFDLAYCGEGCWNLFGEFELHFGRAERERSSHIGGHRSSSSSEGFFLDRYSRTKDFWGPSFKIGGNYMFCDCYYIEGTLSYLYYTSYDCHDQIYWNSASARVDLGYMF